jgi:hypothetical protein
VKQDAPHHPKMHKLSEHLDIPLYAAVGIMEMVWNYTGLYCTQGDIGRVADSAIARAVDWRKKPEILVTALVDSGFLDRNEVHRLVVHDWPHHAQEWVKKRLARSKTNFLCCYRVCPDSVPVLSRQNGDNILPRATTDGIGKDGIGKDFGMEIQKHWRELWQIDPYRTNEEAAKAKFYELMDIAPHPSESAGFLVANRIAWNAHCESINTKALGTFKWLESGDCWKQPPGPKPRTKSLLELT